MRHRRADDAAGDRHGPHTLRVYEGTVVGRFGDDVFVELGVRMQGVISVGRFDRPPAVGDVFEFTLRGQEESLWALSLREQNRLATWEDMEEGSVVLAQVVRARPGGLELLVGKLHAFLPKSQTGLARDEEPDVLVGKELRCEVIEVDRERQRVIVSRKAVLKREREERERGQAIAPGRVVRGRVSRIEPYGAFVALGGGAEGLIHVTNLAYRHVAHPSDALSLGESVEVLVLYVRRQGKRIGLGLKQMQQSPWGDFAARSGPDAIVTGRVVRLEDYGAFVEVGQGIVGLLHRSQTGQAPGEPLRARLARGQALSVRVLDVDVENERLSLSLVHTDGSRIAPEEGEGADYARHLSDEPPPGATLGKLIKAWGARGDGGAGQLPPA